MNAPTMKLVAMVVLALVSFFAYSVRGTFISIRTMASVNETVSPIHCMKCISRMRDIMIGLRNRLLHKYQERQSPYFPGLLTAPVSLCDGMTRKPCRLDLRLCTVRLPAQDVGEHQRSDYGGVGLHDESRRVHIELAPGDLLVRNRS